MAKRIILPGHYYGLPAICARMGWSSFVLRARIVKHHFPAFREPAMQPPHYTWYTNDSLIDLWYQTRVQEDWNYLAQSKTGRNLLATAEPRQQDKRHTRERYQSVLPLHAFTSSDATWVDIR